jgi:hypothetical protein
MKCDFPKRNRKNAERKIITQGMESEGNFVSLPGFPGSSWIFRNESRFSFSKIVD